MTGESEADEDQDGGRGGEQGGGDATAGIRALCARRHEDVPDTAGGAGTSGSSGVTRLRSIGTIHGTGRGTREPVPPSKDRQSDKACFRKG